MDQLDRGLRQHVNQREARRQREPRGGRSTGPIASAVALAALITILALAAVYVGGDEAGTDGTASPSPAVSQKAEDD